MIGVSMNANYINDQAFYIGVGGIIALLAFWCAVIVIVYK